MDNGTHRRVDESATFGGVGRRRHDFRPLDPVDHDTVRQLLEESRAMHNPENAHSREESPRVGGANGREVNIPIEDGVLEGRLHVPDGARGVVIFAHGSGSSRHSPRNQHVAGLLHGYGLATLLFDLLTRYEEQIDRETRHLRFDIKLLAKRLQTATTWIEKQGDLQGLPRGYFGASTGSAAALRAAAGTPVDLAATVSRGGRPDLAEDALPNVEAPSLFIVGERDPEVLELNRQAMAQMNCETHLETVPNATHLFEEPGALDEVARHTGEWFKRHMGSAGSGA
jgi:dienelactone hydrolase